MNDFDELTGDEYAAYFYIDDPKQPSWAPRIEGHLADIVKRISTLSPMEQATVTLIDVDGHPSIKGAEAVNALRKRFV